MYSKLSVSQRIPVARDFVRVDVVVRQHPLEVGDLYQRFFAALHLLMERFLQGFGFDDVDTVDLA